MYLKVFEQIFSVQNERDLEMDMQHNKVRIFKLTINDSHRMNFLGIRRIADDTTSFRVTGKR